jgi:hypothetical protein
VNYFWQYKNNYSFVSCKVADTESNKRLREHLAKSGKQLTHLLDWIVD